VEAWKQPKARIDWIQFAVLLVMLLGIAVRFESRMARVEQALEDGQRDRAEMIERLTNLENHFLKP
jgi:hypothetical protein